METYYIIYKVTNQINGKVYIGSHKTKNLDDGYMGSGKYLNYAINKHGINNFTKEILFIFHNPTDMYNKEAELVNDDFLAEANTYNIKLGGCGGFDYINEHGLNWSPEKNKNISPFKDFTDKQRLEISRKGGYATMKKGVGIYSEEFKNKPKRRGWTHTDKTKEKIGKANSINQSGTKNSQYGKRFKWMNNGKQNKKVKYPEIEKYLADGYNFGRK